MNEAKDTHPIADQLKARWVKPALQRLDAGSAEEGGAGASDGPIGQS